MIAGSCSSQLPNSGRGYSLNDKLCAYNKYTELGGCSGVHPQESETLKCLAAASSVQITQDSKHAYVLQSPASEPACACALTAAWPSPPAAHFAYPSSPARQPSAILA